MAKTRLVDEELLKSLGLQVVQHMAGAPSQGAKAPGWCWGDVIDLVGWFVQLGKLGGLRAVWVGSLVVSVESPRWTSVPKTWLRLPRLAKGCPVAQP